MFLRQLSQFLGLLYPIIDFIERMMYSKVTTVGRLNIVFDSRKSFSIGKDRLIRMMLVRKSLFRAWRDTARLTCTQSFGKVTAESYEPALESRNRDMTGSDNAEPLSSLTVRTNLSTLS